ncbi:ABC1 family-domain-containing protein [Dunaliella salina]|uniref:ABC1 family-domain-containing protein n=2 Tax=Dunaliella salina TaxID=3046 RepID=A0ABQ7GJK8_DUNSA|nr:ABC1 family-domain-containing protein [Dunaliella salina]|eukprot:KAF5834796.1 ABC1 family-domain-containing protein [Dunaliella salina]
MPHDLALAPPWVLDLLRRQQRFLLQMSLPNWVPTYPWSTLQALYRSTVSWMPSLPGTRALHVQLLGALNIAGSGAQVLRTSVAACLEFFLTTRRAQAQGFEMALPAGYQAALQASTGPWYRTAIMSMASCAMNMSRVLFLLALFAPVLMFAPVALSWNMGRLEWMSLLRRTLECAGPAFIKWGQWAATRHDIFPPDFCAELEMLHTQVATSALRDHSGIHLQAWGVEEQYKMFFPLFTPIKWLAHELCILEAQAFSSKVLQTSFPAGQVVAVKVRHPGVADTILRDFSLMMAVASLASQVPAIAHLRIEDTLKQFAAPLTEQVDLSREASNLQQFNYNFRNTLAVDFPVPLYPLVSNEVLVETFEEGDNISRYIESGHGPINQRLSVIGSGTMLQMMLLDNLIHSDLHPGNILVRLMPPGSLMGLLYGGLEGVKRSGYVTNPTRAQIDVLQQRWLQPQIVLLDVGMATELSDEDKSNMVGLFRSFAAMDGTEVGKWVLRFSGPDQHCPAPGDFIGAMEGVFDDLRKADEGNGGASGNSAETLSYVLEMVRQHKVTLPGHICAVVVTTLVLEGWSNKLDSSHSVLVQVQKMFANQTLPIGRRLLRAVDEVMNGGEEGILAMS